MSIKQYSVLLSRIALFIVYFWFGFLKVVGQSPASEMVQNLLDQTMPFMPFGVFIILFGLFEMAIISLFIYMIFLQKEYIRERIKIVKSEKKEKDKQRIA